MRYKNKIFLELFVIVIIILVSLSFVSAGYVWNGKEYIEDANGENGNPIAIGTTLNQVLINNARVEKDSEGNLQITVSKGGSIEIKGNKYPVDTSNPVDISKGTKFVFDENGNLIKGTMFTASENTKYRLKGYDVPLLKGTEVVFEKDKVVIKVPKASEIKEPEKTKEADENAVFSYESEGEIKLNNEMINTREGKTIVNYDKDGFFIENNIAVKNNQGKDEFLINADKKTYLIFDKNKIDDSKDYVFVGKDKIIVNSPNGKGASVFVKENNRLGILITPENTVAIQSYKGKAIIEKGENGRLADVKLNGGSYANLDKIIFRATGTKLLFSSEGSLISGFEHGKNDAAVRLSVIDSNEKNLKDFYFYSNSKGEYAGISVDELKEAYEITEKKGSYFSSSIAINQLTPEAQKFYEGLDKETQNKILSYSNEKGNGKESALMQRVVEGVKAEEIKRRQSPIKASVRMVKFYNNGGKDMRGSGTIIGVDKEGYPIVATAGHLNSATVPGAGMDVELSTQLADGTWQIKGTVIAGQFYGGGADRDISLVRLNTKIPNIPYTPVAPESLIVKPGEYAQRIGCPDCGPFKKTDAQITKLSPAGNGLTWTWDRVGSLGGESGGGLFYNGKLIGIVSVRDDKGGGGYTSTAQIRAFLIKNGYEYLIKIIIILLE